ncbi:MAG: peptidylprolyl isomerase [Verrucomicrobia bacterium]|nr:peptidylprolyl isomerase [Verrucomicrobiota bacterium]
MRCHCVFRLLCLAVVVWSAAPAQADFTFTYSGHLYTLVTAATNWDSAQADAVARGGTLARIDDAVENAALLNSLTNKGITPTAPDGGGTIYVWIGGRETVEGTYAWTNRDGSASVFWVGGKNGSPANGLYTNWGRTSITGGGPEPDNYLGIQDRVGFALGAWPTSGTSKIGQAGQWNDISGTNRLAYLVETSPPNAPSNLTITVTGPGTLALTWKDNSDNESGFYIGYRMGTSGTWQLLAQQPANATNQLISGAAAGTTYQFLIEAYNAAGAADSPAATVMMPPPSETFHPAVVGPSFSYTIMASTDGGTPDSYSVTGTLPLGLSFNAGTHQITGTPTNAGVFSLMLSVHYPAWGTLFKPLTLRVIYPPGAPVATATIPKQTLTTGGAGVTVPLNNYFTDRDTEKAVRFFTSKGNFDLALYATATPQTVSNFLNYVNRGDYSNSIVHRSVPGFVIQGGGFKPVPPNFTQIPTDPSPTNEPGVQQARGTVAMAKQGSNPNSATDQWFFNLSDNSSLLDDQNGGFTAFGRVCGNGMAVADAIAALPRTNYTVSVDAQAIPFTDWPMDTAPPAPASMDQSKLVLVNAVTKIEPLAYSITGVTVTGLVTSAISGTNLLLTPVGLFGGTTVVTVAATDLDGTSLSQSVAVEVASSYSAWLNQYALQGTNALPGADKDGDRVPNVVEFALMGSPTLSDAAAILPKGSIVTTNGQQYGTLTFKLRKSLAGVSVVMKVSTAVAGASWTTVWTSDDLSSPIVMRRDDLGDSWQLQVRDTTPLSAGSGSRFLRLLVNAPM